MYNIISHNSLNCIERACDILENGGIIAVPTIRWYLLVTLADNEMGVRDIFKAKDRNRTKQPLFVVPQKSDINKYFKVNCYIERLIEDFCPGELTLRLNWNSINISDRFCVNKDNALVYYPTGIYKEIINRINKPMVSTTPNVSSNKLSSPALTVNEVEGFIKETGIPISLIIDGGYSSVSEPTTIIDGTNLNGIPLIEREGFVCERAIRLSLETVKCKK